ncbi:HAD family hydrolase [Labrys sp. ZIDIC5]|uniref:HAD family hydrolase n=1 Tax=Labrys sedimenti TaxID=3106036 RepID=UPI002ACA95D3|nr:HAD family hydrolase [Labrys sp. ZIDIC5]MDZ5452873.1 HAD family hydrolase [Labrys sp. ZIDIC5]
MAKRKINFAIAYDFDGTLAPGNMQEYDFVPKIGMKSEEFWKEVSDKSKEIEGDNILIYMGLMLDRARAAKVSVHKRDFEDFGKKVELFEGVENWFDNINDYGNELDIRIHHYILSSGIREMISGTLIAKKFKSIFASSFWYDHNGVAHWPALALNYTTKTQYLFRINKGVDNVWDHGSVNRYVEPEKRPIPFTNMIFIGDGETDIPCFRLVKEQGGHAIAVYKPNAKGAREKAQALINEGRVNFSAPANYTIGAAVDLQVRAILRKVAADIQLRKLGKK